MYSILVHTHSGLRWLLLFFLIVAIVRYVLRWGSKPYSDTDRKWGLFTLILAHLQLVIGLILYFISPKVQFGPDTMSTTLLRFYAVEHLVSMLIAIALITIGYSRMKRVQEDARKFKNGFWYYFIALIIILLSIPWPFRIAGAGWY